MLKEGKGGRSLNYVFELNNYLVNYSVVNSVKNKSLSERIILLTLRLTRYSYTFRF